MPNYHVREVKIISEGQAEAREKALREYERQSSDHACMSAQVRHFFEMELSSLKAPQTVDFDAIVVTDADGHEIARFNVADFWRQEWKDSAFDPKDASAYLPETRSE
jgi:hypothetical protein